MGSWKGSIFSRACVDSALPGSQEAASLFWTSVSLPAKLPRTTKATIQKPSTIHLVTATGQLAGDLTMHVFTPSARHRSGAIGFSLRQDPGEDQNSSVRASLNPQMLDRRRVTVR